MNIFPNSSALLIWVTKYLIRVMKEPNKNKKYDNECEFLFLLLKPNFHYEISKKSTGLTMIHWSDNIFQRKSILIKKKIPFHWVIEITIVGNLN